MRVAKVFHVLMASGLFLAGCGRLPAAGVQPGVEGVAGAVTGPAVEAAARGVSGGDRHVAALATTMPISAREGVLARDLAYGAHRVQKLDVYGSRVTSMRRPVVVYVHGGGWRMGDKAHQMVDKPAYFNAQGYVFVSINYRLADPALPVGKRPMHPDQVRDVASSLGWVRSNIARYGGDPSRIALIGHSAGAHLAALVASNPRFLNELRFPFSSLKGVIANDTASYDLTTPQGGNNPALITNA
ncbi:MAG: alpha/beta hydrolase, partial [bacterium]|nr:alpha/beta hydrolase [bacterium]